MCSNGCYAAFAEDDDEISPTDLGEAVRDDEGGASLRGGRDGALDLVFGGAVDGGGGVVKEQDAQVGEKGTRERRCLCPPERVTPRSPMTVS